MFGQEEEKRDENNLILYEKVLGKDYEFSI